MTFLATAPFLNRMSVGMLRTSKAAAVCWFSSTLSLTIFRSGRSAAISSSTGATTRHGPHQGAQKSTSTGCSDSMTSAWKLVSVTSLRVPAMSLSLEGVRASLYKVKYGLRAGLGRYLPEPRAYPSAASGRRQQDLVDDVDDPVGGLDVGLDHLGRAVEVDALALDGDLHRRAVERLGRLQADDRGGRDATLDHVVEQDGLQLGLVLAQRGQRGLGDLGERLVGRGEDGVAALGQRPGQAGGLHELDERRELRVAGGDADDRLGGSSVGGRGGGRGGAGSGDDAAGGSNRDGKRRDEAVRHGDPPGSANGRTWGGTPPDRPAVELRRAALGRRS